MAVFLVDGRDADGEPVHVYDAEVVTVEKQSTRRAGAGLYAADNRTESINGVTTRIDGTENICAETAREMKKTEGVTTHLTEHSISFYLDEDVSLRIGDNIKATIIKEQTNVVLSGTIISERRTASGRPNVYTMEILDYTGLEEEYLQVLYDRVPTLPQNLNRDFGIFRHLWVNIANRVGRVKG
jgi:cellulose synthase (UDP-forming)